jgi:hypothetical protein
VKRSWRPVVKMNHSHIGRALSPAAGLRVPPIRIISVYLRISAVAIYR